MKTRVRPLDGGAFSPIAVFVVLLVVLVGVAAFALTRPDPAQPTATTTPQGSPSPRDHSLTDAEAIARFRTLDALRLALFAEPEIAEPEQVFVQGSPAARRVRRALHELRDRGLALHHPTYRTRRTEVIARFASELRLRQTVFLRTETARLPTKPIVQRRLRRQVVEWVLRPVNGTWLIYDGAVVEAKFVKR